MATEELPAAKLKKGDRIQDPGTGIWVLVAKVEPGPTALRLHYDTRQGLLIQGCHVQPDRVMTRYKKPRRKGKATE